MVSEPYPVYTERVGVMYLRPDTSDEQTWRDVFEIGYHVPPEDIWPDAVLDLGANIGLTAADYHDRWPEIPICAVELDADNASFATRNFGGVIHCGVASYSGEGTYTRTNCWQDSYSLVYPGEVTVPVRTITDLLDEHLPEASRVFCKMDVEGTEWEILQRLDGRIRWLLVELHGDGSAEQLLKRARARLRRQFDTVEQHRVHPRALWATR